MDLRPRPKVCCTRRIKDAKHRATYGAKAAVPRAQPAVSAPLFAGTIHFLTLAFATPAGTLGVSSADVKVAVEYGSLIAPVASRYATQYGPNSVAVDPNAPTRVVTPSGGTTYTDAELAGWVDDYAQFANLPAGDAVAVLNPPAGVQNTDASVSQGVLGYHSLSPKRRPYLFVNAQGAGFSVADPEGYYALALSHEVQEMLVDPGANGLNPEVCDECAQNCSPHATLELFDANSSYLGAVTTSTLAPPAGARYAFYLNSMVLPAYATQCPPPASACAYPPP
jgi:hypothetical protein